jgi:hypothetical protein
MGFGRYESRPRQRKPQESARSLHIKLTFFRKYMNDAVHDSTAGRPPTDAASLNVKKGLNSGSCFMSTNGMYGDTPPESTFIASSSSCGESSDRSMLSCSAVQRASADEQALSIGMSRVFYELDCKSARGYLCTWSRGHNTRGGSVRRHTIGRVLSTTPANSHLKRPRQRKPDGNPHWKVVQYANR